ncbi:MAG: hypothetical protein A2888_00815 [Chlamydiae bacterium RIFCSPLOWO2_01_FULL_28_7]|nr:MAG: hypothetical protein A2888_00815 [Chlamydiae bacterium RIFCSPLOWO2_01_FULL_28_7]
MSLYIDFRKNRLGKICYSRESDVVNFYLKVKNIPKIVRISNIISKNEFSLYLDDELLKELKKSKITLKQVSSNYHLYISEFTIKPKIETVLEIPEDKSIEDSRSEAASVGTQEIVTTDSSLDEDQALTQSSEISVDESVIEPKILSLFRELKMNLKDTTDRQIVEQILAGSGLVAYNNLKIETVDHIFQDKVQRPARRITLLPTDAQFWGNFFINLGNMIIFKGKPQINKNAAVYAFFGAKNESDIKHLIKSYERNCEFQINIALDLSIIDPKIIHSQFTEKCNIL